MTEPAAKYHFASDNTAGVCPEAWAALEEANHGFAPSYGADDYTAEACRLFREFFETDCEVFFVFNGTAANSLALASLCQSYHSVIAHEAAHVETDECGAPEFFSNGTKLLLAHGPLGKLDPAAVEALITKRSDIHYPRARVISLSQPTEMGTIYEPAEIAALSGVARARGLKMHMDGARFLNAVVASGRRPKELSWQAGVDVLCLGGTKIGLGFSEAVVFFDRALAAEFDYRCKQAGQLASKMRYLSAPWVPFLRDRLYERYAGSALDCAKLLNAQVADFPGVAELLFPVQSNAVFLRLAPVLDEFLLSRGWKYYHFIGGGARFMCSWQTQPEDVEALMDDFREGALVAAVVRS